MSKSIRSYQNWARTQKDNDIIALRVAQRRLHQTVHGLGYLSAIDCVSAIQRRMAQAKATRKTAN